MTAAFFYRLINSCRRRIRPGLPETGSHSCYYGTGEWSSAGRHDWIVGPENNNVFAHGSNIWFHSITIGRCAYTPPSLISTLVTSAAEHRHAFNAAILAPLVTGVVCLSISAQLWFMAGSSKVVYPNEDVIISAPALSANSAAETQLYSPIRYSVSYCSDRYNQ